MNLSRSSLVTAFVVTLLLTGCESHGGFSARKQEKSATYAALRPWQKKLIDKSTISQGFTPDMVYLAMGKPTKVETKDFPQGTAELWTYSQFYPNVDAVHGFRHADFTTESAYQPQRPTTIKTSDTSEGSVPVGMDRGVGQPLHITGGPQGGTIEPATLRSYTIKVLFAGGKVVQIGADENMN